jgi:predicted ribosomally synthesized peptide with nif11-like leader
MPAPMKNFYLAVRDDPKLEAQYRACCKDPEKIVELAASAGFQITKAELVEHMGDELCLETLRSPAGARRAVLINHPCLP